MNFSANYNNKKKYSNQINLKTYFNSFNIKTKNFFNNISTEINKNTRYDSLFESQKKSSSKPEYFTTTISKDKLRESGAIFPSFIKTQKKSNYFIYNDNIVNRTFYKGKTKSKSMKKKLNPFKYSNNYQQNCILKQIFKHPNLKLLYETNEKLAKKMVNSQSKSNKKKFSLRKYQYNLIENTLTPFDRGDKNKLIQSFNKINSEAEGKKKIDLKEYLREIQKKERELIEDHNELEEIYEKNIEKIGFPLTGKRKIHIGKMCFKDVFANKKYYKFIATKKY